MNTAIAEQALTGTIVDDVVARGDLSKLTPEQRVVHYHNVCQSLGLNPATQPFGYITLNGKLVLYAKKDATDQLRKINGINIEIAGRTVHDGLITVHARATDKSGRSDEDFGVVSAIGLRGESAANAMMKAVTKAKRRVTLSISGLGFSDESEIEARTPAFSNLRGPVTQSIEEARADAAAPTPPADAAAPTLPSRDELAQKVDAVIAEAADTERMRFAERAATAPFDVPRRGNDAADWSAWGTVLIGYIRAAPDADAVNNWTTANSEGLAALQIHDVGKYRRLMDMIDHQIAVRTEQENDP